MRILGLIPARGGSKGIPKKNIKSLNGKPLLAYTVELALQSELFANVILSTDDSEIIAVAKNFGIAIPFIRPENLALDNTPTIDVILHAIKWFENKNIFFDAVCLLQVTSPFRKTAFLEAAVQKFKDSGSDSLISVQKVPHEFNPHWVFEPDASGNLRIVTGETQIISRRQDLPEAFHRDGSIYITKINVIKEQHSLYGNSIAYIESDPEFYVNIDTDADWEKAEQIIKNWNNVEK